MGLYGNPEIEGLEQVGQIDFSSGDRTMQIVALIEKLHGLGVR